jgi:DNA invertase Pin-like site-specific DNA recombinase
MTRAIAYLRVSTSEQRPDRQIDGLKELCDEVHIETVSAVSAERPIFESILNKLERGQKLVVWDMDRAFRSTVEAIQIAEQLRKRGIGFQVATLMIDTETPAGEYTYTILAATAQFERRILSKRTKEGMEAARRRGVRLGRPPLLTKSQIKSIRQQLNKKQFNLQELADRFGVSIWTIKRAAKKDQT